MFFRDFLNKKRILILLLSSIIITSVTAAALEEFIDVLSFIGGYNNGYVVDSRIFLYFTAYILPYLYIVRRTGLYLEENFIYGIVRFQQKSIFLRKIIFQAVFAIFISGVIFVLPGVIIETVIFSKDVFFHILISQVLLYLLEIVNIGFSAIVFMIIFKEDLLSFIPVITGYFISFFISFLYMPFGSSSIAKLLLDENMFTLRGFIIYNLSLHGVYFMLTFMFFVIFGKKKLTGG